MVRLDVHVFNDVDDIALFFGRVERLAAKVPTLAYALLCGGVAPPKRAALCGLSGAGAPDGCRLCRVGKAWWSSTMHACEARGLPCSGFS